MTDHEYDEVFFGGKGKSKGKRRSSGKGKGRRRNPIGRDGEVMRCGICNSDTHFRAQCPQNSGGSGGCGGGHAAPTLYVGGAVTSPYDSSGPLGDLLGDNTSMFTGMMSATTAPTPAPAAEVSPALAGHWDYESYIMQHSHDTNPHHVTNPFQTPNHT